MKKLLSAIFLLFLVSDLSAQLLVWSDDFSNPSTWVIDNDGQSGLDYGWNINNESDGWYSSNGINSTSGGNYAELVNGDPLAGTQALDVSYTMTTANPIDVIGLAGTDQVEIIFEQYGARFNDLQQLLYSTDGVNFIPFWDNLYQEVFSASGGSTYDNPETVQVDLANILVSSNPVWLQFKWTTNYPANETNPNVWITYGWYIDDIRIQTLPSYDAQLNDVIFGSTAAFGWMQVPTAYTQIPIEQIAPIDFSGVIQNVGASAINATFTATIPGVYSGVSNPLNIVPTSIDTLVVNNSFTPPSVPETYTVEYSLSTAENDADLSNNTADSYTFSVNDYIYARDTGTADGYVYSSESGGQVGNFFDIYNNQMIYAIDAVIHENSVVGAELNARLYLVDMASGDYDFITEAGYSNLTQNDIGNTMTFTLPTPQMLYAENTYLVVVNSYDAGVFISTAGRSKPFTSQVYYNSDDTWYYTLSTPMVRMNFNPDCDANLIDANATISNNCLGALSDGSISVLTSGGSGDYSYAWLDENGVDLGDSETIENLSNGLYSLVVTDNNNTCNQNFNFNFDYEISSTQMDVNTSSNSSTCLELNDGFIYFDIDHSNGASYPPYIITLNNGDEAILTSGSGSAFSLAAGTYTYQVTDGNGCVYNGPSAVEVGANDMNFGIDLQANPSAGQSPLLVIFDNNTPNAAAYNFTRYFGDGTSEQNNSGFVSHTYAVDGLWDVVIVAEEIASGCTDTLTLDDFIFSTGGVSCTHTATLDQSGSLTGCPGSIELSCNTDASFSYQWNINGVPINGATSSTYAPQTNGTYSVTIYQDNCPVNSNSVMVTLSNAIAPIISAAGNITSCEGGAVTLDAGAGYSSYAWSTGGTNQTETVTSSGDYTVTVMDASTGCMVTSSAYTVNASFMDPQQVCIVGMDSLSNYNRVVWEKPISDGIDYFNVYKEGNAADVYDLIGSVPYEDTAIFVDENSNTAVQAYRYKVSIVDSCGTESALGTFHKTIHLTINQGVGQTWNLIWNHYEGFGFPSYNIYRGTDPNNMTLLSTIASNLNSYTDLNPPGGVGIYYQVEVVNTDGCDPLKSTDYGVSRSNIATVEVVNQIELGEETLSIYPNPTRGNVTISASSALTNGYVMYDQQGRVVLTGALKGKYTSISLERLSRGSYTIKVEGNYKPMMLIKD